MFLTAVPIGVFVFGYLVSWRILRRLPFRRPAGLKQLRDFDLTFQPSVRREQIESLHDLGFVERENVIFLGSPSVGTTHFAISLAIAAAQRATGRLRHAGRSHHVAGGGPVATSTPRRC